MGAPVIAVPLGDLYRIRVMSSKHKREYTEGLQSPIQSLPISAQLGRRVFPRWGNRQHSKGAARLQLCRERAAADLVLRGA